ncbi:MAG: phytoene/squalene synthase family protein [Bauldia sp.]|nr:phytoene/squalene synthase family protein [Bauldia sp.]
MDTYAAAADIVRQHDRDRYLADLFAPEAARKHLFALHAFDVETARIRYAVSEPMLGEIRLQWWRDVLTGKGEGGGHPVAAALLETIRTFGLPLAAFDALLAARVFDLYADPMPSLADLEGYAGETTSALIQLGALVLAGGSDPGSAEAAGHAGVAILLARLIARLPEDARRRQMFLPKALFLAHGVEVEQVYDRTAGPGLVAALGELRAIARRHVAAAEAAMTALPRSVGPAFLPLALVEPELQRQERHAARPLQPLTPLPGWRRQLTLWRAARRWR